MTETILITVLAIYSIFVTAFFIIAIRKISANEDVYEHLNMLLDNAEDLVTGIGSDVEFINATIDSAIGHLTAFKQTNNDVHFGNGLKTLTDYQEKRGEVIK